MLVFTGETGAYITINLQCALIQDRFLHSCTLALLMITSSVCRDFFGRQVLSQRRSVPPHTGELVAARSEFDGQWYRARIRRVKEKSAQVGSVELGCLLSTFLLMCLENVVKW